MKINHCILCLIMAAIPLAASSQENISNAFEKFLGNHDVTFTETHKLDRDIATGLKTGQCDIYRFTIPASKKTMVDDVMKAFRKDNEKSYSTSSGTRNRADRDIALAVGNGEDSGVCINPVVGCQYIYSCFLAPKEEDPDGNHRYAYAMNWQEKNGEITGSLVKTYATTLKYRQSHSTTRVYSILGNLPQELSALSRLRELRDLDSLAILEGIDQIDEWLESQSCSWFNIFMSYVQAMTTDNIATRRSLATKIYEHTQSVKSYPEVTEQDKATASGILKSLLADSKSNDQVQQHLLSAALKNLK